MTKEVTDVVDKNMSNVEFVESIMTYSNFGGLAQVFVIEAIRSYADNVLADKTEWPPHSLITKEVWQGIAQELLLKAASKYGKGAEAVEQIGVETQEEYVATFDATKLN